MYSKGEIREGNVMDSENDYKNGDWVYLPHSCDSWVIGTHEQVRDLIADLQMVLDGTYKHD